MDEAIKTQISFVAGIDGIHPAPACVQEAGLTHRFAVIQQTWRPDSADMYFDEALWLALVDFAVRFSPGADVRIGEAGLDADAYLRSWKTTDDPGPEQVEASVQGRPVLVIAPEFWANVGGPAPYHDSYTYSLYSNEDISARILAHLRDSDAAHLWMLPAEIMPAQPQKKTVLSRLWNTLK